MLYGTLCETVMTVRILGTNEVGFRKIWYPNMFQTNEHTTAIVGETEGSRE